MRGRLTGHVGLGAAALVLVAGLAGAGGGLASILGGAGANTPLLLIGLDDDAATDPFIQPPGTTSNQSTRKADILGGGDVNDVLIGREGADVLVAGPGDDVLIGGTEAGSNVEAYPPSDAGLGGAGNDIMIWAPGDGADSFTGGEPVEPFTLV